VPSPNRYGLKNIVPKCSNAFAPPSARRRGSASTNNVHGAGKRRDLALPRVAEKLPSFGSEAGARCAAPTGKTPKRAATMAVESISPSIGVGALGGQYSSVSAESARLVKGARFGPQAEKTRFQQLTQILIDDYRANGRRPEADQGFRWPSPRGLL